MNYVKLRLGDAWGCPYLVKLGGEGNSGGRDALRLKAGEPVPCRFPDGTTRWCTLKVREIEYMPAQDNALHTSMLRAEEYGVDIGAYGLSLFVPLHRIEVGEDWAKERS